ncbi:MAG: hypothetical protein IRZ29_04075 [Thermoflavifilum sp.]|nr:hypothetical protein [Thermoflavifilum sp.]
MHKLTTIILLCLFAFYAAGYYFVYEWMLYQHSFSAMDDVYPGNNAEIAILKIPVYLPYLPQETNEEKAEGSVQMDGIWYRAVSKHLYHDTLYVKCVKDRERMTLNEWFHDFMRFSFGNTTNSNNHQDLYKSFFKEYLSDFSSAHLCNPAEAFIHFAEPSPVTIAPVLDHLTPPPKSLLHVC